MSSIDNPAQPSSQGGLFGSNPNVNDETSQQSRGGLFSDTTGVGTDLSGIRGEQGPVGPQGPQGLSVSRVTSELLSDGSTTRLTFYVGTGSSEEAIPVTVDVPGGLDAADDFSNTVNVTTACLLYTSPSPRDS